jgi:alkylhydroperoxidase family enzyme
MAWIRTIADADAEGRLKRQYDAAYERAGKVFNIVRVMSVAPHSLQASLGLYQAVMFGPSPLSRALRELLATHVSRINSCDY